MKIDVSELIGEAKRKTREWAEAAGYQKPPPDEGGLSKQAREIVRILKASDFGCQQRNVELLVGTIIGETLPSTESGLVDYAARAPFLIGSVLVPTGDSVRRAGMVIRTSSNGNAGLRASNGELNAYHFRQEVVRPATDEEIEQYFREFFCLETNPADLSDEAAF